MHTALNAFVNRLSALGAPSPASTPNPTGNPATPPSPPIPNPSPANDGCGSAIVDGNIDGSVGKLGAMGSGVFPKAGPGPCPRGTPAKPRLGVGAPSFEKTGRCGGCAPPNIRASPASGVVAGKLSSGGISDTPPCCPIL